MIYGSQGVGEVVGVAFFSLWHKKNVLRSEHIFIFMSVVADGLFILRE